MDAFDLNKLPEENEEGFIQEEDLVKVGDENGNQGVNNAIDLNELPEEDGLSMPEKQNVMLNESTWEIILFSTAIYFPIVVEFLRR